MRLKKMTAVALAAALAAGSFGGTTAFAADTTTTNDITLSTTVNNSTVKYVLSIPSGTKTIKSAKDTFSEVGTLQVKHLDSEADVQFDNTKKVSVAVTYSGNLTNTDNSITANNKLAYKLVKGTKDNNTDIASGTTYDFSADDIDKETGSVAIGAVVTGDPTQVENGTYTDKVTFTASVVSATKKLTLAVSLIREIRVMDKTHIEIIFDYDDQYRECMEVIAGMENEDDMGKDYIPAGEKLSGDLSNEYVKRIFALFLEEVNYTDIAKLLRTEGIPSPLKYYYAKRGNMEKVAKVKDWDYSHVSRILSSEYYIGNSVHGKQVKCLATGEKNRITDRSEWIRVEGTHEPIIDKETFEKVQEKIKELSARHPKKLAVKDPNYIPPPENKFSGKIFCGDCEARMRVRRQYHISASSDTVHFRQ